MITQLPNRIKSAEQAIAFLTDLHNNGEAYHPEDSTHDIVWDFFVSNTECKQLNLLMDQCFHYLEDPCEVLLNLVTND